MNRALSWLRSHQRAKPNAHKGREETMNVACDFQPRSGQLLSVQKDAVPGKGEDAFVISEKDSITLFGVFDGCGGLGARKYANCNNHTAAYIASRMAAASIESWFSKNAARLCGVDQRAERETADDLKKQLILWLTHVKNKLDMGGLSLMGSLVRPFPTTVVLALIERLPNGEQDCRFFWAGDSRGYVLTANGLYQCTKDDLRFEGDAFENLYEDSPLSNLISADGAFEIHTNRISLSEPAVIITATDGAFAYLSSPMHFEWLLLRTMCNSADYEEWKQKLYNELAEITGDDMTICMQINGWAAFSEMKVQFMNRCAKLAAVLENAEDRDELEQIWQTYKFGYEQRMK